MMPSWRNALERAFLKAATLARDEAPRERVLARWRADHGDERLRLDYALTSSSVVFDVGGYQGQWASDIFSRFLCRVDVFEPVKEFAQEIERRFSGNDAIVVHAFGLGATTA